MEDLRLDRIAALVPEFAVKDLPLGRTHDDDDVPIIWRETWREKICSNRD